MWCATPNARCWWCGTDGFTSDARARTVGPVDRPGRIFVMRRGFERMRLLPQPPEIRIRAYPTPRCSIWLRVSADVAEFTIVHLPQRFDRRPAVQIGCEGVAPRSAEPTREKSAGIEGNCRPGLRSLGHRRHFSSPVRSCAAKRCRRRNRLRTAAAPRLSLDCLHSPQCNLGLDRFKMIRYISRCK